MDNAGQVINIDMRKSKISPERALDCNQKAQRVRIRNRVKHIEL